ncbi:hypothetical protein BRC86_09450 [Halobacteriales archaeon QS_3_64_16]|nr:MAG: hypothetical protein BRC86_09450 [Halobacteriales archaeon QS_3_64_16]
MSKEIGANGSRRWFLAATAGSAAMLAGCSGSESESGGSGGGETSGESGGGGSKTTSGTSSQTATQTNFETTTQTATETATQAETDTTTTTSSESGGGSSSISDSGDTDVELQSADVADVYSLDSVAYYEEDYSAGVRGEATNTSDDSISYTDIQAKFYDSDGTRLGEALDNASDLGDGETYAFDAISTLTGDKSDSVASYTISISDGF